MTDSKKINSLLLRLEKARISYQKAKDECTQKHANLGWGYGMRCVKFPSFTKEDNAKARVNKIENDLKQLGYTF